MRRSARVLIALAVAALAITAVASASASPAPTARYIVVLKTSQRAAGIAAVRSAGGKIVIVNKVGIATVVSANRTFALQLRRSGTVAGVAHDAWFQARLAKPQSFALRPAAVNTVPAEQAACAALFGVPVSTGPDPLGACQWDMRAIDATTAGSYGVNQGAGTRVGDIDTGIDLTHPDLTPNLDVADVVLLHLRDDAHVPAGGAGGGRRLLEQGGGPGLRRPRYAHGRDDRLADQRPGHRRASLRSATLVALKAGTAQGYLLHRLGRQRDHLRGRSAARCREHELLRGSLAVQLPATMPSSRRSSRRSAVRLATRNEPGCCPDCSGR